MEKFFLKIDAKSPDGRAVKCETQVEIACTSEVAVNILAALFRKEASLKEMFTEALIMSHSSEPNTEPLSEEDYNDRIDDPEL